MAKKKKKCNCAVNIAFADGFAPLGAWITAGSILTNSCVCVQLAFEELSSFFKFKFKVKFFIVSTATHLRIGLLLIQ